MKPDSNEPSYTVAWSSDMPLYQRFANAAGRIIRQFVSEVIEGPGFEYRRPMPVPVEEVHDILSMNVSEYNGPSDFGCDFKIPEPEHHGQTPVQAEPTPDVLMIKPDYSGLPRLTPAEA
jgi:hypothetical protein